MISSNVVWKSKTKTHQQSQAKQNPHNTKSSTTLGSGDFGAYIRYLKYNKNKTGSGRIPLLSALLVHYSKTMSWTSSAGSERSFFTLTYFPNQSSLCNGQINSQLGGSYGYTIVLAELPVPGLIFHLNPGELPDVSGLTLWNWYTLSSLGKRTQWPFRNLKNP